jgi:hypothetical protein
MIDQRLPAKASDALSPAVWLAPWAALAAFLSLAGVFTLERRLLVPLSLVTAVSTLLVCHRTLPRFRTWTSGLDLRAILGLHALRAPIGVGFLVLEAQGKLTGAFAQVAGFGDIAVGLLALALLATFGKSDRLRPGRALLLWNAFGLIDILVVVAQAQRLLLFVDPEGIMALAAFPGSMLPTFVVPLVITTHLLVFRRAFAGR